LSLVSSVTAGVGDYSLRKLLQRIGPITPSAGANDNRKRWIMGEVARRIQHHLNRMR
jgi:hypothetical protein